MRTKLKFVLKHVSRGALKVNVVIYLTKPPQPMENIAMKKIHMKLMIRAGVSDKATKILIRIIGRNVKETKVRSIVTTIEKFNMS